MANFTTSLGMTLVKTAGKAWLTCERKDALSQWLFWMKRYMPLVATVKLTHWIVLKDTAHLQTLGGMLHRISTVSK